MKKLYKFKRLIDKYSVEFTLSKTTGRYVAGKWEQGDEDAKVMRGAIVPMGERKLYSSGGTYTTDDRQLYLCKPLSGVLSDFSVLYNGNVYAIENDRDFSEYGDVAVYALKWQSKAGDKK